MTKKNKKEINLEEEDYMTVAEVASCQEVSKRAVYNWLEDGLEFYNKKESRRKEFKIILISNLDKFLSSRENGITKHD